MLIEAYFGINIIVSHERNKFLGDWGRRFARTVGRGTYDVGLRFCINELNHASCDATYDFFRI